MDCNTLTVISILLLASYELWRDNNVNTKSKSGYHKSTYRRVVWRPGQKDPLITLVIGGVQSVEKVRGHVILHERENIAVPFLIPLLGRPLASAKNQLLCRNDKEIRFQGHISILPSTLWSIILRLAGSPPNKQSRLTIFNDYFDQTIFSIPSLCKDFFHFPGSWEQKAHREDNDGIYSGPKQSWASLDSWSEIWLMSKSEKSKEALFEASLSSP